MTSITINSLADYPGHILHIHLSFREVIDLWEKDESFCLQFSQALANIPFSAFFWEMPPLTTNRLDLPFECVVIDSPALAQRIANPRPFLKQLQHEQDAILAFPNLGKDAMMVVPRQLTTQNAYCHLAVFLRDAPQKQQSQLWGKAAQTLKKEFSSKPLWLSTSGLGVSWLHLRLDSYPKYYVYRPYRRWNA